MKNNKINILIKSFLVLIICAFSFRVLAIWSPTISNPTNPENNNNALSVNPYPPLNISLTPQQKAGILIVGQDTDSFSFISKGLTEIEDRLKIDQEGLNAHSEYILMSDANGNATWQILPSSGGGESQSWVREEDDNDNDDYGMVSLINKSDNVKISIQGVFYKRVLNEDKLFIHNRGACQGNDCYNIFMGINAGLGGLENAISGASGNVGLGVNALYSLTDPSNTEGLADYNTAVGYNALYGNTTGSYNTALGDKALNNNTTGNYNTAIGYRALGNNITGSYNTALGNSSGPFSSGLSNTTAIGDGTVVSAPNTMVFGNNNMMAWSFGGAIISSGQALRVGTTTNNGNGAFLTVDGQWSQGSDRTKKHDIVDLSYGLEEVMKLRPVDFKWNGTNVKDFGFIAQEVKEIIPEIVAGKEGEMGMSYNKVNVVLVKALQEQQEEIKKYEEEFETLKERLYKLQTEN